MLTLFVVLDRHLRVRGVHPDRAIVEEAARKADRTWEDAKPHRAVAFVAVPR